MENKTFQIDSNIISNKKKSNKSVNKNSNNKKTKSKNNIFFKSLVFFILIVIGLIFWIKKNSETVIKDFSDGKIIVCKDRLVSKELNYIFNKNENAFINKKEGLFFNVYYCSDYVN